MDFILESVQDFLIKLDMKPCMHLVEISIFSLNHSRVSNIESDNSHNVGLENISDQIFPYFTTPSICKIQGCVKNICHVSFNYKLHCIITYLRQTFEFMLTKVEHVRVKHCTYALERIYLVLNHHSQRKVIAVPGELKFIFNS